MQWGQGLEPDLITYTTAITACGAVRQHFTHPYIDRIHQYQIDESFQ